MTKRRSRTRLKKDLQVIINEFVDRGCVAWYCSGPNKPIVPMGTCWVCANVKELRKIRDDI